MSKNVDAGDFYYDGQDMARTPYYHNARSNRSSYNKAIVDIRPDAAPLEVSPDFFGFLFGSKPATISSPSDRRLPDFPEIRNTSLEEPSLVSGSISDFESGVKCLSNRIDEYEAKLDEIEDEVVKSHNEDGAADLLVNEIGPFFLQQLQATEDFLASRKRESDSSIDYETEYDLADDLSVNKYADNLNVTTKDFCLEPISTTHSSESPPLDLRLSKLKLGAEKDEEKTESSVRVVEQQLKRAETVKLSNIDLRSNLELERTKLLRKRDLTLDAVSIPTSEDYILAKQNFFYCREKENSKPDIPLSVLNEFNQTERDFIVSVLNFRDVKHKPPEDFVVPKIVYCPSGGGKTTMISKSTRSEEYLDIDDICRDYYDEFHLFSNFLDKLKYRGILMNRFFQFIIHAHPDVYKGKILYMCHPKQLPHYMRGYGNELILIPVVMNWNIRFFRQNFFSLLGVMGKPKILAHYDEYEYIVRNYFELP